MIAILILLTSFGPETQNCTLHIFQYCVQTESIKDGKSIHSCHILKYNMFTIHSITPRLNPNLIYRLIDFTKVKGNYVLTTNNDKDYEICF